MSEPLSHPPAKKGLSPLAWVAIGCGALLLLGGIIFALTVGYIGYKGKQLVEGFENEPVTTMAKAMDFANPELELVEVDEEARRATFRNIETGEMITVDAEDLENGRISFESNGEKVTFDGSSDEEGGGSMTVTGAEGTTVYRGGAGSASDVPSWVPIYPGGEVEGAYSVRSDQGEQGTFTVITDDDFEEVIEYYEAELEDAGYAVEATFFETSGLRQKTLTGRQGDEGGRITVIIRTGMQSGTAGTAALVQYES